MIAEIRQRPIEIAANLNPVLGAYALWEFAKGYESNDPKGPQFPLMYFVLPIVMHGPTRLSMPRNQSTRLQMWLEQQPQALVGLPTRIREISPLSKEALLFASFGGLIEVNHAARFRTKKALKANYRISFSPEVREILEKSQLCGKWFGQLSDLPTILLSLGMKA